MPIVLPDFSRIDPLNQTKWSGSLNVLPQKSFFYGQPWAEVLQRTYGYRPHYFVTRRGKDVEAFLPVMEVDSWLTGRRGISLPFADDCPPAAKDEKSFRQLLEHIVAFGQHRNWKYLEFRGGRQWMPNAPSSVQFFEHRIDLAGGESEVYRLMDGAIRRGVKKSAALELKLEPENSSAAMIDFYNLLCLTRRKHGLPPQPLKFFLNIKKYILDRDLGRIFIARFEDIPIAAAIYFFSGDEVIYKYGASDERFQHLRPNNHVMWEALKSFVHEGFKCLNLGRTSLSNGGLRRYKLGWGAREERLDYFRYGFREMGFVSGADDAAGWHNPIFSRLPLPLSRGLGNFLYRHWA